jgi:CubicO group peptidase (beta-lactamase class C family)
MFRLVATLAIAFVLVAGQPARADGLADRFPAGEWEHADPAAIGWSTETLKQAEEWSHKIGSTAVMVIHHGAVVAEWGDTAAKTPLASVRKSLLNALIGNAVARGEIDLTKTIGSLGIDDTEPSLSPEEKTATVRDLLEARSGVYHAALYETAAMAAQRPPRHSHPPGTFWYYNNWDFNTLGAIYEHATRHSIFDAFAAEIASPVGMQDYEPTDGSYVTGAASVYPAYPFEMSARDLARFALLYLHKGAWRDRQVVPADWVEESTKAYTQSPFGPGYGYLWWTGFLDNLIVPVVKVPPGTFFAWGFGGQFAFVMPAYDLVVVHRAPHEGGGSLRPRLFGRLLWLVLDAGRFPDIGPDATVAAAKDKPLDGDALKQLVAGKTLRYGDGAANGPIRVKLDVDGDATALRGADRVQFDAGTWRIDGDRFCRDWHKTEPLHACWSATGKGDHISLFDGDGLMVIDAHLETN